MEVPERVSDGLDELSALLVENGTLETTLRQVADLAVTAVDSCDACGVSLVHDAKVSRTVGTDDVARRVDEHQYRTDEGH